MAFQQGGEFDELTRHLGGRPSQRARRRRRHRVCRHGRRRDDLRLRQKVTGMLRLDNGKGCLPVEKAVT
jgi:hypothetical protein